MFAQSWQGYEFKFFLLGGARSCIFYHDWLLFFLTTLFQVLVFVRKVLFKEMLNFLVDRGAQPFENVIY